MCGRFGLSRAQRDLAGELSDLDPRVEIPEVEPRYNIAPTQPVLVLRRSGARVEAAEVRWGISLPWARDGGRRDLINVRAETALEREWFRQLLERHRVLIPASHFYEWCRGRPMLIESAAGEGLAFGGLLAQWTDPATGEVVPAAVVLTTPANGLMAEIHDRMPVLLPRSAWGRWLDPDAGAADVADLLAPCPDEWLRVRPIGTLVNDVTNEGPALIEPAVVASRQDTQLELPW